MPRQKTYFKYNIPSSVVCVVTAIISDYDRRERAIRFSLVAEPILVEYTRINSIIEMALCAVEEGIRRYMLDDICEGRGYDYSLASPFIAKNTYYARKRKIIYDVAKGLMLV